MSIRKNQLRNFALIIIYILCYLNVWGKEHRFRGFDDCRVISQKEGLSNNKIKSIAKDKYGTIWIGTQRGLNRVVENKVLKYNDHKEFLNQPISFVVKDKSDQIWVATSKGLYLYDYNIDRFNTMTIDTLNIVAHAFGLTSDGILFNTSDGIVKHTYKDHKTQIIQPRLFFDKPFNAFQVLNDSLVITAINSEAIYKLNIQTNEISPILKLKNGSSIKDILIDTKQRLWVSIYNKGLSCIDLAKGIVINTYNTENSSINHNIVLDLEEINQKLWIASDGGGLNVIDMETYRPIEIFDKNTINSINKIGSISTIFYDCDNNDIWLGTIRHGVINIKKSTIRTYTNSDFDPNNENKNSSVIQSLCEDSDKNIWFGTDGGGLKKFNIFSKSFSSITSTDNLKIVAIENVDNNWLLISVYNKGIYKVHKLTGEMINIPVINKEINDYIFSHDMIVDLSKYNNDNIYIIAKKLYNYNISSGAITELKNTGIDHSNGFRKIYSSPSETILQNYYSIYLINNHTLKAELILNSVYGDIISARRYKDQLWINQNYCLRILDIKTRKIWNPEFQYNNQLLSIETDLNNMIWLTTYDKLIHTNPMDLKVYTIYDNSDGVAVNDYFANISLTSTAGLTFIGGNAGLLVTDNLRENNKRRESKISMLYLKVDGEKKRFEKDSSKNTVIELLWNYHSVEFGICIENDCVFKENKFKYIIHGENKKTILYSDNTLSLPVLSPGKYDITILYNDNGDTWVESDFITRIIVLPPWWKSSIFIFSLYLLIILASFGLLYYYYITQKTNVKKIFIKEQKDLVENKSRFLINISHELRTPLTLIYAPLKRLLENSDIDDKNKSELTRIFTQTKHMIRLVNMSIDTKKMEEGHDELLIGSYPFNEWIKNIVEEFRIEYNHKNIQIIYDLDNQISTLNFDEQKIRIAVSNFIMNAYKYSNSESQVIIKTELKNNRKIRLSVIDEGIGLMGIDINTLFNRFVQAHDKSKGSGLGLAYTKLLIESHPGGEISAFPNHIKGSTFYFEISSDIVSSGDLNKKQVNDIATGNSLSLEIQDQICTSKYSVLIVEDDSDLLNFMSEALTDQFKQVCKASNGEDALRIISEDQPDIILSDVMMPMLNGYELCNKIKNDMSVSHIPIILLTAQVDIDNYSFGYKSGADVFLPKPFDIETLLIVMKRLLSKRKMAKDCFKSQENISVEATTFSEPDEIFMTKLNDYIYQNIDNEELNVKLILDHMCMGRAAFYKKLKAITDIGVMSYVTNIRMRIAADKLNTTLELITDIAMSVGYQDIQHFSKSFKQHYNVSPSVYRKRSIEKET